eukprot:2377818-Ditylum_brightwellii.AAC.1
MNRSMDEEEVEKLTKGKKGAVDSSSTSVAVHDASIATAVISLPTNKTKISPNTLITLVKPSVTWFLEKQQPQKITVEFNKEAA